MQMAFYSLQYTLSITCISGKFETITISTSFTILRVLYVDERVQLVNSKNTRIL